VIASGGGRVVLFSSGFGLVAAPRYTAYNASKFAVRGPAESLRLEMALERHPVSVSCVYPGVIATPIVSRGSFAPDVDRAAVTARFAGLARMGPGQAASVILRKTERGKGHVLVGRDAQAAAVMVRAAGSSYPRLMSWVLRHRSRPSPS
jgi:short-subunit dehydrogenase